MEIVEKIKFIKGTYDKMLEGDENASENFDWDITLAYGDVAKFVISLTDKLENYCEDVEAGNTEWTAFYVDVCKLLDRPVNVEVLLRTA